MYNHILDACKNSNQNDADVQQSFSLISRGFFDTIPSFFHYSLSLSFSHSISFPRFFKLPFSLFPSSISLVLSHLPRIVRLRVGISRRGVKHGQIYCSDEDRIRNTWWTPRSGYMGPPDATGGTKNTSLSSIFHPPSFFFARGSHRDPSLSLILFYFIFQFFLPSRFCITIARPNVSRK